MHIKLNKIKIIKKEYQKMIFSSEDTYKYKELVDSRPLRWAHYPFFINEVFNFHLILNVNFSNKKI